MNSKNKKYALLAMATISLSILLAMPLSLTPGIADSTRTRGLVGTIESALVETAPTIDGDGSDTVWESAVALTVDVEGTNVDIKTVYTDTDIYFLAIWSDTTESDTREQWSFDGTINEWVQAGKGEDRLSLIWNISATDFSENGCSVVCHFPDMNTTIVGETVDTWHWKATRSNPSGWLDDKYFNNTGRHGDDKASGGYSSNKQNLTYADDPANYTDVPKYWEPSATGDDAKFILQSEIDAYETTNITTVYTNGTIVDEDDTNLTELSPLIPGHYQSKPVGSRGDVGASGIHDATANEWTLEWNRALDTGNTDDLQFSDTSTDGEYFFGVAVFDDQDAFEHSTTASDVFKLVFEQPNQDPGTPTIDASATTAEVDETITFDVSGTDPDGDTLTYSWDFGDGTTDSGASVTHAFAEAGTYTVTVTADDGNGGTSTQTQSITVEEAPEDAGFDIIWILLIIIIIVVVVIVAVVAMKKKSPPLEEEPLEEEPVAEEEPLAEEE